jgi:hypothetical protein
LLQRRPPLSYTEHHALSGVEDQRVTNPDVLQRVEPAHYFPLPNGRYQVKVGLSRLGTDWGNGRADRHAFQLDSQWPRYRQAKLSARAENLAKYYATDTRLSPRGRSALAEWMILRLYKEHHEQFQWERHEDQTCWVHCQLSGETIELDRNRELSSVRNGPLPTYADTLDALASQVQEDIALVELDETGADRLTALHLCFPNYWAAQSKIGMDFITMHQPVPRFDKIARQNRRLTRSLIMDGPFVRFAWGLTTDARLNHHPHPPPGFDDSAAWYGRRFDTDEGQLYLRVERQFIQGLPGAQAFAFTVRTYLTPITELDADERKCLAEAVETMPRDARRYKGLAQDADAISCWLRGL